MSRSKKDQAGGHPWPGYNKENWVMKQMTKRKRRQDSKRAAEAYVPCPYCNDDGVACDLAGEIIQDPCWCTKNEEFEPGPQKSTGGWLTW